MVEQHRSNFDQILEDIRKLKEIRRESLLTSNGNYTREETKIKLEKKLTQLLYLIMEESPTSSDINENIKIVIRDVDKLKGRTIEGHLKTRLLFSFLKEYKQITEESAKNTQRKNTYDDEDVADVIKVIIIIE